MWSYTVALPTLQAEFGVARADASLPFTFVMIRFAAGGVLFYVSTGKRSAGDPGLGPIHRRRGPDGLASSAK
jgi:hypothetical protein